jgi:hypothetical protein
MIVNNMYHRKDYTNAFIVFLLILSGLLFSITIGGPGLKSVTSLLYIAVFLYYLPNRGFRKIAFSSPMLVWIVLAVYHTVNALNKHVPDFDFPDVLVRMKIYCSIVIFAYLLALDFKRTLKYIFYALATWLTIGLFYAGYNPGERLAGEGIIIAVQFGKSAAVMGTCGIYLTICNYKQLIWVTIRLIYPMLFILLSQTRQALGMLTIQFIGFYYAFVLQLKTNFRSIVLLAIGIFFAYNGYTYIMEETGLGTRIQDDIEEAGLSELYSTGTVFDYIAGERIYYYVVGAEIFNEHPWTGIGLDNFRPYTGGEYPMHVEWMVHLTEGGIIAFVLYITFLVLLFINILRSNERRPMKVMQCFTLCVILFSASFASSYEQEIPVILYSIILSAMAYSETSTHVTSKSTRN